MKKIGIIITVLLFSITGIYGQQKSVKVELINKITMTETTTQNGKTTQEVFKDFGVSEINRQLLVLTKYRIGLLRLKNIEDNATPDYKISIDAVKNEFSEFSIIQFVNMKTGVTTLKTTDGLLRKNQFQDDVSKKIIKFFIEIEKNEIYSIFLYDKKIEDQKFVFAKAGTEIKGNLGTPTKIPSDTERLEIVSMDPEDMNTESSNEIMVKIKYKNEIGYINTKQLLANK